MTSNMFPVSPIHKKHRAGRRGGEEPAGTVSIAATARKQMGHSWLDVTCDFQALWDIHPEAQGQVMIPQGEAASRMYGRLITTPRWQQTYGRGSRRGKPLRGYHFTGMTHPALPLPEILQPYLDWVNGLGYGTFNEVLVNWYANGHHYIGSHSDDERQLVPDSPIPQGKPLRG